MLTAWPEGARPEGAWPGKQRKEPNAPYVVATKGNQDHLSRRAMWWVTGSGWAGKFVGFVGCCWLVAATGASTQTLCPRWPARFPQREAAGRRVWVLRCIHAVRYEGGGGGAFSPPRFDPQTQ
jgi:hypothetical protein